MVDDDVVAEDADDAVDDVDDVDGDCLLDRLAVDDDNDVADVDVAWGGCTSLDEIGSIGGNSTLVGIKGAGRLGGGGGVKAA